MGCFGLGMCSPLPEFLAQEIYITGCTTLNRTALYKPLDSFHDVSLEVCSFLLQRFEFFECHPIVAALDLGFTNLLAAGQSLLPMK